MNDWIGAGNGSSTPNGHGQLNQSIITSGDANQTSSHGVPSSGMYGGNLNNLVLQQVVQAL